MKTLLILFLLPLKLFSQDLTGIWTGTLYNDTTHETINYELTISEYKGKLSGYSHTTFIIDGVENVGVKSVNVKNKNNKIFIEDDELIWNNYPVPPPKGVKMASLLDLTVKDTVMILSGIFNTNRTRQYRPVTGTVHLEKRNNASQTKLVVKLKELERADDLSFLQPKEKVVEPAKVIVKKEVKPVAVAVKKEKIIKPTKVDPPVVIKPVVTTQIQIPVKLPAADVSKRIIENIQSVTLKTDSVTLTLYDNGEVDGDTVSVLLNGKIIMPNQGLSTKAITKTIYLTPEMGDSIQLIMYAENLGSIPPNTGLLILQDGDSRYEIRFAGDLQKNSAIILKRRTH